MQYDIFQFNLSKSVIVEVQRTMDDEKKPQVWYETAAHYAAGDISAHARSPHLPGRRHASDRNEESARTTFLRISVTESASSHD